MDEFPEFSQLQEQLDWHYRADAGLQRLRSRLRRASRTPRVPVFVRRFAAVAALLLVLFGLTSWLGSPIDERPGTIHGVRAMLEANSSFPDHAVVMNLSREVPAPGVNEASRVVRTFTLDRGGKSADALRQKLRSDGLPRGPRVDLALEVHNGSPEPLVLHVGGERSLLRFDLRGPGTLTLAGKGETPPFLKPRTVELEPGASYYLPIPHLIGGRPGQLQGTDWTAPGRYTLAVHYRVGVEEAGRKRDLNVSTAPLTFEVQQP